MLYRIIVPAMLVGLVPNPVSAQLPGAGSVLGMPDISSISPGNAAGVLGYCVKNKYLSGSSADQVLGGLMKKPGVEASKDYKAGAAGELLGGKGVPFSLGKLPKDMKSKACGMVLKQGTKLL